MRASTYTVLPLVVKEPFVAELSVRRIALANWVMIFVGQELAAAIGGMPERSLGPGYQSHPPRSNVTSVAWTGRARGLIRGE
jgi:hypothetical protein